MDRLNQHLKLTICVLKYYTQHKSRFRIWLKFILFQYGSKLISTQGSSQKEMIPGKYLSTSDWQYGRKASMSGTFVLFVYRSNLLQNDTVVYALSGHFNATYLNSSTHFMISSSSSFIRCLQSPPVCQGQQEWNLMPHIPSSGILVPTFAMWFMRTWYKYSS